MITFPAMHKVLTLAALLTVALTIPLGSSLAAEQMQLPDGSKVDLGKKCPVCSMLIGGPEGRGISVTYTNGRVSGFFGVATTIFKDGKVVGFDGARCLFLYNSIPWKYGVRTADMKRQYVTDFVSKRMIEIEKAFLVLGSDVKGRMGYEMIPFVNKKEALKFAGEHNGKWIIQLHAVKKQSAPKKAEEHKKEARQPKLQ